VSEVHNFLMARFDLLAYARLTYYMIDVALQTYVIVANNISLES